MNILRLEPIGSCIPEEFKSLVDKNEGTLTEENFCTIKIFYKQRIFQNLIQLNNDFNTKARQNYLRALAYVVEEVPIDLPIRHLERVSFIWFYLIFIEYQKHLHYVHLCRKFLFNCKNL